MGAGVVAAGGEVPELVRGFEVLAEAPDGPARMRDLVLALAVRGKLVAQGAGRGVGREMSVTPSENAGAIRGPKGDAAVIGPFDIPRAWRWQSIGSLLNLINGRAFKPAEWSSRGTPIIRIQNLNNELAPFNYCDFTVSEKVKVRSGDLLISWSGTPGTSFGAFIWERGEAVLNQHIFRAELLSDQLDVQYVRLAINARLDEMIARAHGAVGLRHITKGELESMLLPVPALAEQRRIVARVDELMALIDQFEAARTQREAERSAARDACLAKLCAAANPDEVATAWSTVASHFDTLFTSPDDIAPLRQSILQLAVRGKLVRQRASEEAASALLARIGGKTTTFPDDSLPPIPVGWATCRFGDLLSRIQAGWSPSCSDRPKEGEEYGVLKVSACSWGKFLADENKALPARSEVPPGIEVRAGDFLISRANTVELVARSVVVGECPDKLLLSDKTLRLTPLQGLNAHFLNLANLGPDSRRHYEAEASGTSASMRNVSQEVIRALPLLLPPKLEQDRIVARVDELMTLCDQLESRVTAARDAAADFASAAVAG